MAEIAKQLFECESLPVTDADVEIVELVQLSSNVWPDEILGRFGYCRIEPWRDLRDGGIAVARVGRVAVN